MHPLKFLGVALAAIVVAAALVAGAGANTHRATQIDFSTTRGVHAYLRSLGLNPSRFVIQRGAFNYSGARCPGKKWTCTKATRVVQISTAAPGGNTQTCTDAVCSAVQVASSGGNTYTCNQSITTSAGLQSCIAVQKQATGSKTVNKNTATVTQSITQSAANGTKSAEQVVKISQNNDAGPSEVTSSQQINQSDDAGIATAAAQSQTAKQTFYVAQCSPTEVTTDADGNPSCNTASPPTMTGSLSASVTQKVVQNEIANSASSGTQRQESTMNSHVNQWSGSSATASVDQNESQNVQAPAGVLQTQIGPMGVAPTKHALRAGGALKGGQYCCTTQGTNPSDKFTVTQASSQTQSPPPAFFRGLFAALTTPNPNYHGEENQTASCGTYGSCTRSQSQNGNGNSQTGGGVDNTNPPLMTFCSNGVCSDGQNLVTSLVYSGSTTAKQGKPVTLAGTLTGPDASRNIVALQGQDVTLAIQGTSLTCTARTDLTGTASCTVIAPRTKTTYTIGASYAGAGPYLPSSATGSLVVS